MSVQITRIFSLPPGIERLIAQSQLEGFNFVMRLKAEFVSGQSRFDQPGEALFTVSLDNNLVGIGGVNQEPYQTDRPIGRIRRVYISPKARNLGLGRELIQVIEGHAAGHFSLLQLYTDTQAAASFYHRLGYQAVVESKVSHRKILGKRKEK